MGIQNKNLLYKIKTFPIKIFGLILRKKNLVVVSYEGLRRPKIISLIKKIKSERKMVLAYNEAYQIYAAVKATEKIKGDIAEVGVYKGGSSKLIAEAKGKKTLHLFDTFEGIPDVKEIDDFYEGQFDITSFDYVKDYLKKYPNIRLYKGVFPSTARPIQNKKFSFVHLDVDIYESTKDCLKFFYPRMSKGGIIISHDYITAAGVRNAFEEFFKNKPEPIVELSGSQCLIVKI
jgi:hypothetical protein